MLRPAHRRVQDAKYLKNVAFDAIGDQVRETGHDQFPSAGHPSRPAKARVITQALDGIDDPKHGPGCRDRVVGLYVGFNRVEIA